jgi:hypothetical protein
MQQGEAMSTATLSTTDHRPALGFLRHLGEMTLAMFVGMRSASPSV